MAGSPSKISGVRVVIADDSPALRRALSRQLELIGMNPFPVADLETLGALLREDPPDVVLLDWHFGGRTASEVVRICRERRVPVVVLTGDPESVGVEGVSVLGKPAVLRDVMDRLRESVGSLT